MRPRTATSTATLLTLLFARFLVNLFDGDRESGDACLDVIRDRNALYRELDGMTASRTSTR